MWRCVQTKSGGFLCLTSTSDEASKVSNARCFGLDLVDLAIRVNTPDLVWFHFNITSKQLHHNHQNDSSFRLNLSTTVLVNCLQKNDLFCLVQLEFSLRFAAVGDEHIRLRPGTFHTIKSAHFIKQDFPAISLCGDLCIFAVMKTHGGFGCSNSSGVNAAVCDVGNSPGERVRKNPGLMAPPFSFMPPHSIHAQCFLFQDQTFQVFQLLGLY